MIQDLFRRAVAVGRWLAFCAKLVASFPKAVAYLLRAYVLGPRPKRPETPDPGNRRLRSLAAEPVFASLPPDTVRTDWQEYPAKYWTSFFAGGSRWFEPSVALLFTSSQSVLDVHRFYAERALETGWQPSHGLPPVSTGLPWSWTKDIAGKQAFVTLRNEFDRSVDMTESKVRRTYRLNGSIWK